MSETPPVKKRVGRPPKNPEAPKPVPKQKKTDDVVRDLAEKKRKNNWPTVSDNDSSSAAEISEMLGSVLRWYGKKPVKSDEECAERLEEFFDTLAKTGELPSVEKMCLALGVTRTSVWNWENGIKCSPARTDMIKRAKEILAAMDAELVSRNKIPQVTYIFRAKNFFGMKDQTDVVVTPNNPIGGVVSEEELAKRIAGDVVVDTAIDGEFSE